MSNYCLHVNQFSKFIFRVPPNHNFLSLDLPPSMSLQVLNKEQQELAARNEYNFDHPDAFDFELLISVLRKLKKGKSIKVPVYDFTSHCRRKEWVRTPDRHTAVSLASLVTLIPSFCCTLCSSTKVC